MPAAPTLYLIPTNLAEGDPGLVLPPSVCGIVVALRHFIAENAKTARGFLKAIGHPLPLREIQITELNEHTPSDAFPGLLAPLRDGLSCGLLSERGCPAIADPGGALVLLAHESGIAVRPLVGPSSILLALMASGLEGQRFVFHGYLSAARTEREQQLKRMEEDSRNHDRTQIFIETPYRNTSLFESLMACCAPSTLLCIAADLTGPQEAIATRTIAAWRRGEAPPLRNIPAIFLILANSRSA